MRNPSLCMEAVALPVLMAAQAAAVGDAVPMCQELRATGATDIAKATLLLRAKRPRVPAGDAAAFERENAAGVPDARAAVGDPLYHIWLEGRYLGRATRQIGTIPTATSTRNGSGSHACNRKRYTVADMRPSA